MTQAIEHQLELQSTTIILGERTQYVDRQEPSLLAPAKPVERWSHTKQVVRIGLVMMLADVLACGIAILLATSLAYIVLNDGSLLSVMPWSFVFSMLFLAQSGLYPGLGINPADEIKKITVSVMLSTGCSLALAGCCLSVSPPGLVCITFMGFVAWGAICALRGLFRSYLIRLGWTIPYFILGERNATLEVYKRMHLFGKSLLRPAGRFVITTDSDDSLELGGASSLASEHDELHFERQARYLGKQDDLTKESLRRGVSWLFVVDVDSYDMPSTRQLSSIFPQVVTIHTNQYAAHRESMFCQGGIRGARFGDGLNNPVSAFTKRALDVIVSGSLLLMLSPLFAVVAFLIKFSSEGPVFFSHSRLGKGGRTFHAWKFRSMVPNAQQVLKDYLREHPELRDEWERDHKLKDDPRITWIGKILRKTSLDELPQLWNVFVGEMSLVGPRPIVKEEIAKYAETYEDYVRVVPGITGLWQISGRNNTTYAERLFFDRFYVSNWSIWLDLFILVRTVKTVLFCEGAY